MPSVDSRPAHANSAKKTHYYITVAAAGLGREHAIAEIVGSLGRIKKHDRRTQMKLIAKLVLALALATAAYCAQDVVSAVHGTIDKIDAGTKTVVVKTADGTRHSLHLLDRTAVHGADLSAAASKDSWRGLSEGGEVVAHYTKRGGEDTAVEIDKVGQGGLKAAGGTVIEIDRGGRKLVVDTGTGAKETFELTGHASEDAGKDVAKATAKESKVAVYYTEDAGKKVAHFFEAM
jgi:hypothetical protein